jgi:hypothetical protein
MLETRMLNILRYRKFKQRLVNYRGVYVWIDDAGMWAAWACIGLGWVVVTASRTWHCRCAADFSIERHVVPLPAGWGPFKDEAALFDFAGRKCAEGMPTDYIKNATPPLHPGQPTHALMVS